MKAVRFSRFGGPDVLWKKRKGLMDPELPQTLGHEAAGIVDPLGEGVTDAEAHRVGEDGRVRGKLVLLVG